MYIISHTIVLLKIDEKKYIIFSKEYLHGLIILSVVLVSYIYIIHSINSGIKEYSSLNVELIKTLQEREKTNNKINDDLLSLNNEVIVSQKQYKKNESNKKTLEDKYNSLVNALFAMKGRLPSFGDGDLIISKPYCMSSFPYPYGMGKKRNELTEGLEKFVVEYMEVFEVTNHPLLNNK